MPKVTRMFLLSLLPLLSAGCIAKAQVTPTDATQLKTQIEELQAGQQRIENTLNALSNMLASRKPTTEIDSVAIGGFPGLGDGTAKIVLVEFSDFECRFCGDYYATTFPLINDAYIRTGKIRYVTRNFPLEARHPFAMKAAEAAYCAGEQGRYWEYHDKLFTNQKKLSLSELKEHAAEVGLAKEPFDSCLASNRFSASVERDIKEGRESGVGVTPTFLLGYVDPKDPTRIKVQKTIKGSVPFMEFQSFIDPLLTEPSHVASVANR